MSRTPDTQPTVPSDFELAFRHAQTCFAAGLPAAHLFRQLRKLAPDHLGVTRLMAIALAAEGERASAEELLAQTLATHPDWLDGHKTLATMRWTSGQNEDFARSYNAACAVQPRNLGLRLAWFYAVATLRDWASAARILDDGEKAIGDAKPFTLARLYVACESGIHEQAEALLAQTESVRDAGLDICRIRYFLRTQQLVKAEEAGLRLSQTPAARLAWPYLSLIWRLCGDARADWLDGAPPYVKSYDLDFSSAELRELAMLLRQLHTASAPYMEQSVRGGTQTDRPLFLRQEPIIQTTKRKIIAAVGEYIAALPAPDSAHPLLGLARGAVAFEGSWSVRLRSQGYHVSHTHPVGWISSAFYVALPDAAQLGPAPAGWISFGTPPTELGLDLPSYRQIEPKPGRLALFPSTMWHSTLPFNDGERLVVAFDVRLPGHQGNSSHK
jgi:hypothetical protein